MGLRNQVVLRYGLLLFEEDLLPESKEFYEEDDEIEELDYYSDFEGEAYRLSTDSNNTSWPEIEENLCNRLFLFGPLRYGASIYKKKAHYKSYEEIKDELIKNYGEFVSDKFPWEERIIKLVGTVMDDY